MKLRGKVAIITGAASGIGQASAIAFAREGAKVVVVDVNERGGEETSGMVHALGGEGYFDHADVSSESAVRKMVSDTIARWGRIDILFNNAGVVLVKPLEETTEAEWDRVISINLKAAFLDHQTCSASYAPWRRRRHPQYWFNYQHRGPVAHSGLRCF